MSTRVAHCLKDCHRHGDGVEVWCRCGHYAVLDVGPVIDKFERKGWSQSFEGACWLPSAHARFRCTKCGKKGAMHVGPRGRG